MCHIIVLKILVLLLVKILLYPPNLYLGFQPPNLPQFSPKEALQKGTLWPIFYDYYENPYKKGGDY